MNPTLSPSQEVRPVVESLSVLLADSYALQAQAQFAHWNVEGPAFFQLHDAFQQQYEELFAAVDELAERIRALGAPAPGGLRTLAALSSVNELKIGSHGARELVDHMIEGHRRAAESAAKVRDEAAKAEDPETEDLAIARVRQHEKTIWMLRSFMRGL